MEHSEIAELSNEKDETEQLHTKEEPKTSEPESSHSNESDYVDEQRDRIDVRIAVCPAVEYRTLEFKSKDSSQFEVNKVHPFMLE